MTGVRGCIAPVWACTLLCCTSPAFDRVPYSTRRQTRVPYSTHPSLCWTSPPRTKTDISTCPARPAVAVPRNHAANYPSARPHYSAQDPAASQVAGKQGPCFLGRVVGPRTRSQQTSTCLGAWAVFWVVDFATGRPDSHSQLLSQAFHCHPTRKLGQLPLTHSPPVIRLPCLCLWA